MSGTSAYLESLIDDCGGFSRFQWITFSLMMYSRVAVIWSMLMMTFAGAIPDWQCRFKNNSNAGTTSSVDMTNGLNNIDRQCYPSENTTIQNCQEYEFSDLMNTVVSEWTLVCDRDWIAAIITTLQIAGVLVSCIAAGHLADYIGRKPTFLLSLAAMTILNIVAGFSTSWKMFAVFRFLLGVCIGGNFTVFYTYLIEFIPAKRRSLTTAFPSWAISACVFGFMAMWLHDWRYLHFSTAVLTLPCIFMWWFLPESFRYLVAHNRLDEAKEIVCKIARINGKPEPDISKINDLVKMDLKFNTDRKYTIFDIARSPQLRKNTCLLSVAWYGDLFSYKISLSKNIKKV